MSALPGSGASRFASPSPHDLPSETRIHSALAALPQNIQPQVPAIPGALMSPPAIPGSPDLARFSDPTSAFAFLEEARPLFGFAGLTSAPAPTSRHNQNPNRYRLPLSRRRILHHSSAARQRRPNPTNRSANSRRARRRKSRRILPRLQLPQRNPPTRLDSIDRTSHILTGGAEPDRSLLTQSPRRFLRRRLHPPRLPHPPGARQRQAPHLARQRRDNTKTPKRHRPPQLLLLPRKFQHPPRRSRTRRTRHRRLRSRP